MLINIEISANHFSGSIPSSFGNNLRLLKNLNLRVNNFSASEHSSSREMDFITSLTNCRYLRLLSVEYNPLNGILPPSVGNLSESLQSFYVSSCKIRGRIPKEIGNLTNLINLALSDNSLIGFIPMEIQGLYKLQGLFLDHNELSGFLQDTLCTFEKLSVLSLSVNQISGSIPECLGNVTSLGYIDLSSNYFNGTIPVYFWGLGDILDLNLSSNFLSGSVSPNIGNLKNAYSMDLSMNVFSGNIPSTFGNLQNLITMSLAHNRFNGSIPDIVSEMLSLETLDLSDNNLSGDIPKSMEKLQHLTYFNVSVNNLSGEIPSDGPFRNFTSQSFMFNKGLCGAPRFNVPPCPNHTTTKKKKLKIAFVLLAVAAIIIVVTGFVIFLIMRYRKKKRTINDASHGSLSPQRHRRISYYELQQATDRFNESNLLGVGGFGSVYKGVLSDGVFLAVKVFNLEVQGSLKSFDAECEVLRNLRHRNLTKVISSCSQEDFKAIVLEYIPNGSLYKWLYSHNHFLDIMQRLNIMIDVAFALEYLHHGYSNPVVHCDLKSSNVLLDEDMVVHVSDFGVAKMLGEGDSSTQTRTLATLGYMAPEYGMVGRVSTKYDVYSYGIMLMEVFTRIKPDDDKFSGDVSMKKWVEDSLPKEILHIVDANLINPKEQSLNETLKCLTSIMELALNCTEQSPRNRPSTKDILPALQKIKTELLLGTQS